MDPDAALAAILEAIERYESAYRECNTEENLAADDLVEAFEGLDSWLCRGGMMPRRWAP